MTLNANLKLNYIVQASTDQKKIMFTELGLQTRFSFMGFTIVENSDSR